MKNCLTTNADPSESRASTILIYSELHLELWLIAYFQQPDVVR